MAALRASSFDMLRRHVSITHAVAEVRGKIVWDSAKSVQTMLGHASAAMTLDTYADLFPDDLDAIAERLDAAVRAQSVIRMCSETDERPSPLS